MGVGRRVMGAGRARGGGRVKAAARWAGAAPGRLVSAFMPGAAHAPRQPRGRGCHGSCAGERIGKDRLHLFRIAAGSAEETRAHLLVAIAWGYVERSQTEAAINLLDRQLRLLSGLTR